jgi:hypothetical protein
MRILSDCYSRAPDIANDGGIDQKFLQKYYSEVSYVTILCVMNVSQSHDHS